MTIHMDHRNPAPQDLDDPGREQATRRLFDVARAGADTAELRRQRGYMGPPRP